MENLSLEDMIALMDLKKEIDNQIIDGNISSSAINETLLNKQRRDVSSLTQKQQNVLKFIILHISKTGAPPTRSEISEYFGFKSCNSAQEHLKSIEKKGFITMKTGYSRSLIVN